MVRNGLIIGSMIGVALGATIACGTVFLSDGGLASLRLGVAIGASCSLLSLVPLAWLMWKSKPVLSEEEAERLEFEKAAKQATLELRRQTEILQQRERRLADRFLQYQTWMEYPIEDEQATGNHPGEEDPDATVEAQQSPIPSTTRVAQERALKTLLEKEAEIAFNKIKANAYTVDGRFAVELVRDDLRELIINVARIYHPESANPLLETSIEQLLRAFSRTSLQLLVLVERIPINLAEFNLQNLYSYLRRGLRAYQVYQNVRPLLPYVHYASYAGRILLGTNPISLGAQWALWKLGSKGATAATRHLVNRQALNFLHDSITIIGFEVAGIYDPGLRHRDRYWIFAVELTELLSRFPMSREMLVRAFGEVGGLPLRSEYDRVFLYRCMAAHRSGGPQRFDTRDQLAQTDRQWIAKRLAGFANQHLAHRDAQRLAQWQADVQKRLGVSVVVSTDSVSRSDQVQLLAAAESLVAFLLVERQQDFDDIDALLDRAQLFRQIKQAERANLLERVQKDPPAIYDLPDLDPQSSLLSILISDMARLTAATVWQAGGSLDSIEWAGEFFRIDAKKLIAWVQAGYREELERRSVNPDGLPKLTVEQITAILETVPSAASIEAIFPEPRLEWDGDAPLSRRAHNASMLLIAWENRLVMIEINVDVELIWSNDQPAKIAIEKSLLQSTARVTGGEWHMPTPQPKAFRLSRSLTSRHDYDFDMLQKLIQRSSS